jgi:hypothetical protein
VPVMAVNTTLKDERDENYKLGPYSFASEEAISSWKDEFDMLLADFYCEIRPSRARLAPLLVYFEDDVPILHAVPAPPARHLALAIRGLWRSGELNLNPLNMAA